MERKIEQETCGISDMESLEGWTLAANCPSQILVIDQSNGPADILMDFAARLHEGKVCTLQVQNLDEAWYRLHEGVFSLVVFGLPDGEPQAILALLGCLRDKFPQLPVLVVTYRGYPSGLEGHSEYADLQVVELPGRAVKLKMLIAQLVARYLQLV